MYTRFFSLVFSICLGMISIARGQATGQSSGETAIRSAMQAQEAAWNRGDVDAFMDYYWKSDSLQFIGSNGPTYGWQPTLDNYRRRYPNRTAMGKLSFDILSVNRRSASVISLVGKFHLEREIGDLEGYFLLIWQKIDGCWVIVADCTN